MVARLIGLASTLITPPASLFIVGVVGLLVARRRKRLGLSITGAAALTLWLLCSPWVAGTLLSSLQPASALPAEGSGQALPGGPQAIVVLAAGWNRAEPEYGGVGLDRLTQERMRYAAHLAQRTGLPVVTSGGPPERDQLSLAEMMALAMQRDYGVQVRWTERFSRNTRSNARHTADVLFAAGLERVFLVTHAWHMGRAVSEFERAEVEVTPAPTGFRISPRLDWRSFWPSSRALRESTWAFHEIVGRVWYALTG